MRPLGCGNRLVIRSRTRQGFRPSTLTWSARAITGTTLRSPGPL